MLNVIRRGRASIVKSAHSPSVHGIWIRSILSGPLSRGVYQTPLKANLRRQFTVSSFLQQGGAHAEAIENDIADGVTAQRPPSDANINEAVQHGPVTKFKELAERRMVCPTVVRTLTESMGLETMTQVQSMTINETLKGGDVYVQYPLDLETSSDNTHSIAQARTGTGKTIAFLIPVLQNIINYDPRLEQRGYRQPRSSPDDIRAIIISPTRELAEQIAVEARSLTRNTGVIVQIAVGGTHKSMGLRAIKTEGCHIMVGTPGRIHDIFSDPHSQVRAPDLSALVLDEADRLLDQGFAPDIEAIQRLLPDRKVVDRQTLLFSATVPPPVIQIARRVAKPDFSFIRTVQEGELQTHERVSQKLVVLRGLENQIPALVELCKREIARKDAKPFKAIVYFNVTADVSLAANIIRNLKNPGQSIYHQHPFGSIKLIEIHAQLSQKERTQASTDFRRADSAIMVSTDVTARGMDFPNVTHVIQMGIPSDRDTYIHRVGRTGRSGKDGESWIFLSSMEAPRGSQRLRRLPLKEDRTLEAASVDMSKDAQLPEDVAKTLTQSIDASRLAPYWMKAASYRTYLGLAGWAAKRDVIEALNRRVKYGWGLETPPRIAPSVARRLGIMGLPGVELGTEPDSGRGGSTVNRGFSGGRGPIEERRSFGGRGPSQGVFVPRGFARSGFGSAHHERSRGKGRFDRSSRRGGTDDFDPASRYDRTERSGGFSQDRRRDQGLSAF
ncbi:MAG: hypothetical protein Q9211_002202 [Gyalolechia sp. 1 TL-2023]